MDVKFSSDKTDGNRYVENKKEILPAHRPGRGNKKQRTTAVE
jgi:hypothetical protein